MAITDRSILKNALSGMIGSSGCVVDPLTPLTGAAAASSTRFFQFLVSDAATAGTAVTETAMAMPVAGKVVSMSVTAPIAVTASTTVYATVTLSKRTGAGAAAVIAKCITNTVAGDATYGTGSLVAFVPFKVPSTMYTAANVNVAADDVLTIAIAKASTGTALTAATSYFVVTVGVEDI